jgi:hypothetical protein
MISTSASTKIIICEPQCYATEHVEINAALAAVISRALSETKIMFMAKRQHANNVNVRLKEAKITPIESILIKPPKRGIKTHMQRLPEELRLVWKVFLFAYRQKANKIIFCSVTETGLFSIKLMIRIFPRIKCMVILHGMLENLINKELSKPWNRFFDIKTLLRVKVNINLRFLVLAGFIRDRLCKEISGIDQSIFVLEHPYFFHPYEPHQPNEKRGLRFGSLGVGHSRKGTDVFIRLAKEICTTKIGSKHRFIHVGPITDKAITDLSPVEVVASEKQLDREIFRRFAREVDYVIYPFPQNSFQLTASGSLFDAFSFLKPVIAMRSPIFQYYFSLMGEIGYLCNNIAELTYSVSSLCNNFPNERYQRQRDKIYDSRKIFDIQHSAEKFKRIWTSIEKL